MDIKQILKRFLPASSKTVSAYNQEVQSKLKANEVLIRKSQIKTEQAWNEVVNAIEEIKLIQTSIKVEIVEVAGEQRGIIDTYQKMLTDKLDRAVNQNEDIANNTLDTLKQVQQSTLNGLIPLREHYENATGEFEKRIQKIQEALKEISKQGEQQIGVRREEQVLIQQQLEKIQESIPNKPIKWSNEFERKIVNANWGKVSEKEDFHDKFLKLIKGMDSDSIATIVRIIKNQETYLNNESKCIDLFTREEQEELLLLKEYFHSQILKVSENLYAYRNYLLPINHFEASVFYFKHGIDMLSTLYKVKSKAILDVGGFIGDSVLVLAEIGAEKIYTFEAVPDNFEMLNKTIQLNNIKDVVAENVAVGESRGVCTIQVAGAASTMIDRQGFTYRQAIEVPVISIDDYVKENDIEVGLIKVDIEGGEPEFLDGAKNTICAQKPILLISIYHNEHDFFEIKPLIESWDLGYTFKIHKPTYGNTTSETLLLAEVIDN